MGIPPELRIIKEEPGGDADDYADMEIDEPRAGSRRDRRPVRENGATSRSSRSATAGPSRRRSVPAIVERLPPTPIEESFEPPIAVDSLPPTPAVASFTPPATWEPLPTVPMVDSPPPVATEPLPPTPVVESFAPPYNPRPTRSPILPPTDPRPTKKRRIATPSDGADDLQLDTGFFQALGADGGARNTRSVKKTPSAVKIPRPATPHPVIPRAVIRRAVTPQPVMPRPRATPRSVEISRSVATLQRMETPSPVETLRAADTPPVTPHRVDAAVAPETAQPASEQRPVRKSVRTQPVSPAPPPRYTCPEQFPAHRPPAVPAAHVIFASPKLTNFPKGRDVPSSFPTEVLESFVTLEANGPVLTEEEMSRMAQKRVDLQRKVAALRELGRTMTGQSPTKSNTSAPSRSQLPRSHHALLLDDALRFHAHMLREEKQKISRVKKIVKAVNGYWSALASRKDRRIKDAERKVRAGARNVAKLVRAKWKLAVQVSFSWNPAA